MPAKLRNWSAALLFALVSFSSIDLVSAAEPLKSGDWMYRVTYNPAGEKVVEIKWAVQNIDSIKVVRIPWGYRSLLLGASDGAQVIDNTHQESRDSGYATTFSFSVILPEGKPHTGRDPFIVANNKDGETGQGLVYGAINKKYPTWEERRVFGSRVTIAKAFLYTGPERFQIPLVPKSPRFDLNRIGPEKFIIEEWRKQAHVASPIYNDMWFDGVTPEDSRSVVVCGSDERFDGSPDPENGPNHLCQHYFTVDKLTASAKLSYRKKYLKDWREIRARVDALLSSFVAN